MRFEFITLRADGAVMTITLNRPAVRNAISPAMHWEMQAALDGYAADPDRHVCVITGAGDRAFCAGSDLKMAAAAGIGAGSYPPGGYAGLIGRFDLDKPIIASVNGAALGGGFEIALACDLIIAADTARFGLPEPRVGAVALGGGLHRLARQIGLKQAMAMVLTGESVSAAEGARMGFVNQVVPAAALAEATLCWCAKLLACAPLAIRASKQTMLRGLDEPSLAAALHGQQDYPAFAAWRAAEDTIEGPRAFAEKRRPRWQGR